MNINIRSRVTTEIVYRRGGYYPPREEKPVPWNKQASLTKEQFGLCFETCGLIESKLKDLTELVETVDIHFRPTIGWLDEKGPVMWIKVTLCHPAGKEAGKLEIVGDQAENERYRSHIWEKGFDTAVMSAENISRLLALAITEKLREIASNAEGWLERLQSGIKKLPTENSNKEEGP